MKVSSSLPLLSIALAAVAMALPAEPGQVIVSTQARQPVSKKGAFDNLVSIGLKESVGAQSCGAKGGESPFLSPKFRKHPDDRKRVST